VCGWGRVGYPTVPPHRAEKGAGWGRRRRRAVRWARRGRATAHGAPSSSSLPSASPRTASPRPQRRGKRREGGGRDGGLGWACYGPRRPFVSPVCLSAHGVAAAGVGGGGEGGEGTSGARGDGGHAERRGASAAAVWRAGRRRRRRPRRWRSPVRGNVKDAPNISRRTFRNVGWQPKSESGSSRHHVRENNPQRKRMQTTHP
jgi:hypothetical protein